MTAPQSRAPGLENLSHSLIGLVAGESFARCTRSDEKAESGRGLVQTARRSLFVAFGVIGGNLPDADLLWSYPASDRRLGYILEHRGYTHSLLGCLVLGALLYIGAEGWMRWRRLVPSARDRIQLALAALVSTLLHLGMDALNSYGVHPLWPFDNRWFYGDAVFIAEPLFWLSSAPLIFLVRSGPARGAMSLVLVLALGATLWMHRGSLPSYAVTVAIALGLLAVGRWSSPRAAALTSATAMVLIVGVSVLCERVAVSRIDAIASSRFPADRTLDRVLSATPTRPLCWEVLLLGTEGDRYIVRDAVLSIAPGLLPVRQCPTVFPQRPPSAPRTSARPAPGVQGTPIPPRLPVNAPNSAAVLWLGEYSMSRSRLAELVDEHCRAAAFMQFARAPFAYETGSSWYLSDLRFERGSGFQIELLSEDAGCSIHVPWVPPRTDLLHPQSH
jgi:inner membrane protein